MHALLHALLFALLFGAASAHGAAPSPAAPSPAPLPDLAVSASEHAPLQRFRLADGTQVFLVRDTRTPLIWMEVVLGIGSWSPWMQGHHGREAFNAQDRDQDGVLAAESDRLLVPLTTFATPWSSRIILRFLTGDREGAMALLRSTMDNQLFDRSALRRGKWARGPYYASQQKEPRFVLQQALARMFFPDGDARRLAYEEPLPLSADRAELVRTRDQILRVPGRLITFVGDLTQEEATRIATGLLPPPRVPPGAEVDALVPPFFPENLSPADVQLTLPGLTQVFFQYGRMGLGCTDPDYAKLLLADTVLWNGLLNSRLTRALRAEQGDSYAPGTVRPLDRMPEIYSLYASTRTANAARMEQKLRATLLTLHQHGITESELSEARANLLNKRERSSSDPFLRMDAARWEWERGLPQDTQKGLYERVGKVSLEEVNAFIRRFYDPAKFALVRVGPPAR